MDFSVIRKYKHSIKGDSKICLCKIIVFEGIHNCLLLSGETFYPSFVVYDKKGAMLFSL